MQENLVIVESPAKAKTISGFLGKDFIIKSSFGHIRDLSKDDLGIDLKKKYKPYYIVPNDKKNVVKDLKSAASEAHLVWLATDEDREGEAIAWHLAEVLNLPPEKIRRIVFHEITRDAIKHAINHPRGINHDLVNAQQARRVLDRLVGFELSPLLWKKVKPALSAGRVQSVAVRLIVEKEREINNFSVSSSYRITGNFIYTAKDNKSYIFNAEYPVKIPTREEAKAILEKCRNAQFSILDLTRKPSKKSPAAPFTTSTLQQEASRKLGFSVSQTMTLAQRLYEAGRITYMRTDSVNLSNMALAMAKKVIESEFGPEYSRTRNFKTKTKGAQEAHEAIRPTFIENKTIPGNRQEQRLYDLIWKRTTASQMSEAIIEKTSIKVGVSTLEEPFIASGEVIKFDGFLKLYMESSDEDTEEQSKGLLPPVNIGDQITLQSMDATQRYAQASPRYTEASLVKKLEELGIGRPSTYAPTISTIQNRGYAIKEDRPGKERDIFIFSLESGQIKETTKTEIYGAEKAKLFPTDIGMLVNDFLVENFNDILDFNFTASVEKEFDKIAEGTMEWTGMIDRFYPAFHNQVVQTTISQPKPTGIRNLGVEPVTGKNVYVKMGPFGPMLQIGESGDQDKPKFASLLKHQSMETITLEEALNLFTLPRSLGQFEEQDILAGIGKYGPYIRHKNKFYSLKKDNDNPLTIKLEDAIALIQEKREQEKKRIIKKFVENPDLQILNGRWGPYISYHKNNYRIPKKYNPETLSLEQCMEIIKYSQEKKNNKSS
ncbi:MAG: DNA topoisomerase I [Bacteroides sp. SM23_62_1]|nr:MAG: DNA topoisomerase I [Bacteroides sp. SM23_62_1]